MNLFKQLNKKQLFVDLSNWSTFSGSPGKSGKPYVSSPAAFNKHFFAHFGQILTLFDNGVGGGAQWPVQNVFDHCAKTVWSTRLKLLRLLMLIYRA